MFKNINAKPIIDKAKNVLLAMLIFGGVGAHIGAHYANQINLSIVRASKTAAQTVQAAATPAPTVQPVK